MERRKPDNFTIEKIRCFISRLQELGEGLDKLLIEYQPEIRRNEIELLKSFCDPVSVLSDFTPCQIWLEEAKEDAEDKSRKGPCDVFGLWMRWERGRAGKAAS